MSTGRKILFVAAIGVIALLPWAIHAAPSHDSFLQPLGPVAETQRFHLFRVIAIVMLALLPVYLGVPYVLYRYRYGQGKGPYKPDWEFSKPLEWLIWGLPALIIAVLSFWLWHSTHNLDPYRARGPDPVVVQAVGLDWKWLFIYPDLNIATVNELVIPVDKAVRVELTTDTVMQSFLVAAFAGQIYAMPGMTTQSNFIASQPGTAEGENTQFNGTGFGRQKFTIHAMDAAELAQWQNQFVDAPVLDDALYRTIRLRGVSADLRAQMGLDVNAEPVRMRLESRNLFSRIVAKYHKVTDVPDSLGGIGAPEYAVSPQKKSGS